MKYKDKLIQCVADFLLWIKDTNVIEVKGDDGTPIYFGADYGYYRGQSCVCWELKPSVLRESYNDENSLLNKAVLRLSNELSPLKSYLEKLIFFQHYGLCTRLLDVTFNPLVALFMACCDENEFSCDGVVYRGHNSETTNTRIAELTAKYIFEHQLQDVILDISKYIKEEEPSGKLNVSDFTVPIFILPPINNPRIEAQNGAFIMAPLVENVIDENEAWLNKKGLDGTAFFDENRAVIKGNNKPNILKELSVLGIDSGSVYRGVEQKLKAIVMEEKLKAQDFNALSC